MFKTVTMQFYISTWAQIQYYTVTASFKEHTLYFETSYIDYTNIYNKVQKYSQVIFSMHSNVHNFLLADINLFRFL